MLIYFCMQELSFTCINSFHMQDLQHAIMRFYIFVTFVFTDGVFSLVLESCLQSVNAARGERSEPSEAARVSTIHINFQHAIIIFDM